MRPYIEQPESQNLGLEPTVLATPGKPHRLTRTGLGLGSHKAARQVFGRVWNLTEPLLQFICWSLAGNPDALLTLLRLYTCCHQNPVCTCPLSEVVAAWEFSRWYLLTIREPPLVHWTKPIVHFRRPSIVALCIGFASPPFHPICIHGLMAMRHGLSGEWTCSSSP